MFNAATKKRFKWHGISLGRSSLPKTAMYQQLWLVLLRIFNCRQPKLNFPKSPVMLYFFLFYLPSHTPWNDLQCSLSRWVQRVSNFSDRWEFIIHHVNPDIRSLSPIFRWRSFSRLTTANMLLFFLRECANSSTFSIDPKFLTRT